MFIYETAPKFLLWALICVLGFEYTLQKELFINANHGEEKSLICWAVSVGGPEQENRFYRWNTNRGWISSAVQASIFM